MVKVAILFFALEVLVTAGMLALIKLIEISGYWAVLVTALTFLSFGQ